jgi:hypothetical protein
MRHLILGALLCACATPRPVPPPQCGDLAALRWMLGRWCGPHRDGVFCEAWRAEGAGFVGEGAFTRGGAGGFAESLRIEAREGAVFYVAAPEGEGVTAFRLRTCTAGEAVFENPAHDFPTRIAYRRVGADGLEAVVEGAADGGARRVVFALTRVP